MNGDHQVIRHAYENVLTTSARLIAFATGKPSNSRNGYIEHRQDILAIDDLTIFAINSRRLMENTSSLGRFSIVNINVISNLRWVPIPITRIINVIIHHKRLTISRSSVSQHFDFNDWSAEDWKGKNLRYFSPMVMVVSDHNKRIAFELAKLIEIFELEILEPIVDLCEEEKLILDNSL
jgi:hypothetical protein